MINRCVFLHFTLFGPSFVVDVAVDVAAAAVVAAVLPLFSPSHWRGRG